jgi:MYXO-CTERM domain-containing protein
MRVEPASDERNSSSDWPPVGQPRDTDRTLTVSALSRLHGSVDLQIGHCPKDLNMRKSFILGSMMAVTACNAAAFAEVIFNSIPDTLSANYTSQAYQAQQVSEFGDRISFGGSARQLSSATVTMSMWARYEEWNLGGVNYGTGAYAGAGYTQRFTFNIYNAGTGSTPGSLIGSVTQDKYIQYRPTTWNLPSGSPASGIAQNITFDLSGLVLAGGITLPESIVWGLAFNTETYGASPTGVTGPYNQLNVCYNQSSAWAPANGGVTVGSTDLLTKFMNAATNVHGQYGTYYSPTTVGKFSMAETGTTPSGKALGAPMVSFSAVPAPGALALLGVAGLVGGRRRRA